MRPEPENFQNGTQAALLPAEVILKPPFPPLPILAVNGSDNRLTVAGHREGVNAGSEGNWLIWQLADSAFPTGGFAHSLGLEAAWHLGEVRSSEDLIQFVRTHLSQSGRSSLPFVNEAFHESRLFTDLDKMCDAFLSNHVANRGSRAQGQAFLLTTTQTFDCAPLKNFRESVLREKLPGHFAPIFGAVLGLLGITHTLCIRLFLFMSLRGLLAAAVRLGITGPMAAQHLQMRLNYEAEAVAVRCSKMGIEEATQISPLLDIFQGVHDRLYSRLFQT